MTGETSPIQPGKARGEPASWLLWGLGAALVVVSFSSTLETWVQTRLGGLRLFAFIMGFSLIFQGMMLRELRGVRQRNLLLMQTMLAFKERLSSKSPDAMEILVGALKSGDEQVRTLARRELVRLTGKTFSQDNDWEKWWREHRAEGSAHSPIR